MEADDDWVVLSDGGGGSASDDDGSDDCGFVRVRKGGGETSVVVRDATPPTVAAAVPQPTLQEGPFAVISYREAFSASSRYDIFDATAIRKAIFGAGCSSQGAGAGKDADCESEVGEHGGSTGSSVVEAPSTPSVPAAGEGLSESPSGMDQEAEEDESSGEEVDEEEAETSGEEVEDEMDIGTSGEEEDEDEDLHQSSEEDDDGKESFGGEEEEDDVDEYSESCSEEEEDSDSCFGEETEDEDDDVDTCTESCSEEGEDDDEYMQSCGEEENDGTESSSEEEDDGPCTESEEETESCSEEEDGDDDTESLGEEEEDDDDDEYTESSSEEEEDDTEESSGEEAVMEEDTTSHTVADCEHQDKVQAAGKNEEPPAFPVNKYDDIDESEDESMYGYIDIIPSPLRRADTHTTGYCKTPCIACGGLQLGAAMEVEKEELLDFCPCKYDGIRAGTSGVGEGSLESENDRLSELFSKILEVLEQILEVLEPDEEDGTSSSDKEQSDSDDGFDSSDVEQSSDEEEEPVGISYDDIGSSEEGEEEEDEEEEDEVEGEEEGEDQKEHGFDVVDAAAVVQERPPGQRCPGSPKADLTFLVVVYLLAYLAFSYMVMLLQWLA